MCELCNELWGWGVVGGCVQWLGWCRWKCTFGSYAYGPTPGMNGLLIGGKRLQLFGGSLREVGFLFDGESRGLREGY